MEGHERCKRHRDSVVAMDNFLRTTKNPSAAIIPQLNHQVKETIENNRLILKSIISTLDFLARQSLPLRGHRDDGDVLSDEAHNKGNFKALLRFKAQNDAPLLKHLESCKKNASYTSKRSQNDLIDFMADDVRQQIIADVKKSKYFSILADEVSDVSNKEQLCLCLRYVDAPSKEIVEDFIGIVELPNIQGKTIAQAILKHIENIGLDIENCRGQGYDGASNMSSSLAGVQGLIRQVSPKAPYVHCGSHRLNLVIVKSCEVPAIRNMMSTIGEISRFFSFSPKRQNLLEEILEASPVESKRRKLVDLSRTRWIQRHEGFEAFMELFESVHTCLLTIEEPGPERVFDRESKIKASGFRHQMESSEFVIALVVASKVLACIKPLSVKLQKRSQDILQAYAMVGDVKRQIQSYQDDSVATFADWFSTAQQMASSIESEIKQPRIHSKQRFRENPACEDAESYFRISIYVKFLDHLTTQLNDRFAESSIPHLAIHRLVGTEIDGVVYKDLEDVIEFYQEDIAVPTCNFDVELDQWKFHCKESGHPILTLKDGLKSCDVDRFPVIHTLLTIGCTIPVTTCETERGNSRLKLIKSSLRSTMLEDRLCSLMILSLHRNRAIKIDKVLEAFATAYPRRMKVSLRKWEELDI